MIKHFLTKGFLALFLAATITACSSDDNSSTQEEDTTPPKVEGKVYYQHKVIWEDITSVGCQYCPFGNFSFEEVAKTEIGHRFIPMAIHVDYGMADVMKLSWGPKFASYMKLSGYPSLYLNRDKEVYRIDGLIKQERQADGSIKSWINEADFINHLQKNRGTVLKDYSPVGIKISSKLMETSGEVTFSLKFAQDMDDNLRYAVYVLEDGIIEPQVDATGIYTPNRGSFVNDFVHNDVVIAANDFKGLPLDGGIALEDAENDITVKLDYKARKVENLRVVVIVMDKNSMPINAQVAKGNTTSEYEVVE